MKRLLSYPPVIALGGRRIARKNRLVYDTSKVGRDPLDTDAKLFSQHPQIFAMWHGQAVMVPKIKPKRHADIAVIVARHRDGEILVNALQRFGMRVIRGAGAGTRPRERGGAYALRA